VLLIPRGHSRSTGSDGESLVESIMCALYLLSW
jgi:hypothetical protein